MGTGLPQRKLRAVQRVCREREMLLIVDEIQTGLARCGATWACDLYGFSPDILVAGKALGGGVPIGVFITRKDLIPDGLPALAMLTFMNQPLAASAGIAVLDIVKRSARRACDAAGTGSNAPFHGPWPSTMTSSGTCVDRDSSSEWITWWIAAASSPLLRPACAHGSARRAGIDRAIWRSRRERAQIQAAPYHARGDDFAHMLDRCEELTSFIQLEVEKSPVRY